MLLVLYRGATARCGSQTVDDPATAPSLLDLAVQAGFRLGQSCRARGICRSCCVEVCAGENLLTPVGALEAKQKLAPGHRLACQACLRADATGTLELAHPAWGG
ncbi:MAG: 2Fe-2S iron-sulfur cluster-binding protein [Nannocystaceae bacterium]